MRRRGRPAAAARYRTLTAATAAGALVLAGCAQSVDPIERLGKKAAQGVRSHRPAPGQAYRHWGLSAPLAPAPAPAARPRTAGPAVGSLPPVVDHVATLDKVVFLTYDDGAERDPRFVDMVRELRLPVSFFLTDSVVGPGYGHFARLRSVGADIENHTLDHPAMRGLPYAGQRAEICGQQTKLKSRFGIRPRLFRPPYGRYDATTLRAAADCGVAAVVLWRAAMNGDTVTYARGEQRLRPGDIIQVGPDESTAPALRQRTTRLLRRIQSEGLTVGRLEDYL
ncbi:polysaccharide deacetylase family protein [Streptomyces sp. NPDC006012]|uniref:polysaccharide deacetylase family protein n=1 Tax=Streptomyces sp. NPDC006012 TaxID=3364739 RepID=UPI0036A8ADB1